MIYSDSIIGGYDSILTMSVTQNYYVQRTGQALITLFAVITLTFALIRLLPGGPMDYMRAQMMSEAGASNEEAVYRQMEVYTNMMPSDPLYIQYMDYVVAILQGDLGNSMWYDESVSEIIASALPWTLFIMAISLFMTFVLGILLGAAQAYYEGSNFDFWASSTSVFLTSVPYYVFAVAGLFILGFQLNLFPTGGRMSGDVSPGFNIWFFIDVYKHATLPILSLVITGFGARALTMRGNSISVMGEDFLRVARLRGLSERRIITRYVTYNAILPMYTSFMIAVGNMFGGAVILESIFRYHGLGWYLIRSVEARDYPLMMGTFLIITVAVVICLYIADLTYGRIDPRIETGEQEAF